MAPQVLLPASLLARRPGRLPARLLPARRLARRPARRLARRPVPLRFDMSRMRDEEDGGEDKK